MVPKITDSGAYLLGKDNSEPYESKDEFFRYGRATPKEISILKAFNPIERWNDNKTVYRTLCLWA
jgi:hypothetical protein